MSIRTRILVGFVLLAVVLSSVAGLLYFQQSKGLLKQSILDHLSTTAQIQSNRVQSLYRQNIERLGLLTSRTQLRLSLQSYLENGNQPELEKVSRIIGDANKAIEEFETIHVLSLDGSIIASTDNTSIGKFILTQEQLSGARENAGIDIVVSSGSAPKLLLVGPLLLEGQPVGLLVVQSATTLLQQVVLDYAGLGLTGETIIAAKIDGVTTPISPLRFPDRDNPQRLTINPFTGEDASREMIERADYRNRPVLATARAVPGTDWGIIVKIDRDEALRPLGQLRHVLAGSLALAILLGSLLSIVHAQILTKPIARLTRVASRIANGELERRTDKCGIKELDDLGSTFNQMADQLIHANMCLESRVQEKTRQLESANAELDEYVKSLRDTNDKLNESNEGLKKFASIIAHDLRSPLKRIEAFIDVLNEDFDESFDPEAKDVLSRINRASNRMRVMLDAMHSYTKCSNATIEGKEADLFSVLANVVESLGHMSDEATITVDIQDGYRIRGNADLLQYVFLNLVRNSIKFRGQEKPAISIAARQLQGDRVEVSVQDNGIGIPPEYADKVFDMFARLHSEQEYEGTGMGLAICHKIINDHGGQIAVDQHVSNGTRIVLTLPQCAKKTAEDDNANLAA